MLYFCLSLNQEVLIIKSPSDIKEQKKFLGYEWSNRKGDEGLKELHKPYLSPLFERDNPQNETKLNTLIHNAFLKTLNDIPKDLQSYASKARLIDMIDFEKVEFNKAISLNPKIQREEIKSQYPLVKLKICGDFFMGGTPSRKNINYWNGDIKWLTISDYSNGQVIMDTKEKITREGFKNSNVKMIQKGAVVVSIYATIGRVGILGEDMTTNQAIVAIIPNEEFVNKYLMYAIDYFKFQLYNEVITTSQQNINLGILQNMVIPKPPLEIQKQIVAECEKVEEQYNTIRMSIEEYQKLIKAILQKCGIINDGGGYELNSILENLSLLEIKLLNLEKDFNALKLNSNIDFSKINDKEKISKEKKELEKLLNSLPTSPQQEWERVKLGEVCESKGGNGFPKDFQGNKDSAQTPFIKVSDMNTIKNSREITTSNNYVDDNVIKKLKLVIFPKDTIIFPKIGMTIHTNKKRILKIPCIVDNNIMAVNILDSAKERLNIHFLFLIFEHYVNLSDIASLANPPSINNSSFKALQIPLPPLQIQEQIIKCIEIIENKIIIIKEFLNLEEKQKKDTLKSFLNS